MDLATKLALHDDLFQKIGEMHDELRMRHDLLQMQFTIAVGAIVNELELISPTAKENFLRALSTAETQFPDNQTVIRAAQELRMLTSDS